MPLLRRLWLRLFATVGLVAAVMLSWWWKVDAARAPDLVAGTSFGQPIDLGRTFFTPEALLLRQSEPPELVLSATIENVTGETQRSFFGMPANPPQIILDGAPLAEEPEIILLRDDAPLLQLQPRMPEKIQMVWPLPADWQPKPVQIAFEKQTFKLRDNLYGQSSWLGYTPVAQMTVTPEVE